MIAFPPWRESFERVFPIMMITAIMIGGVSTDNGTATVKDWRYNTESDRPFVVSLTSGTSRRTQLGSSSVWRFQRPGAATAAAAATSHGYERVCHDGRPAKTDRQTDSVHTLRIEDGREIS